MIALAPPAPSYVMPAPHAASAGRSPDLQLHVTRAGKMVTVTTTVITGAQGHYTAGESGDGLGNWMAAGSAERFVGLAPGSWTLTVTWVGTGGWASQTVTRHVTG
jgi:hypothetical protein